MKGGFKYKLITLKSANGSSYIAGVETGSCRGKQREEQREDLRVSTSWNGVWTD